MQILVPLVEGLLHDRQPIEAVLVEKTVSEQTKHDAKVVLPAPIAATMPVSLQLPTWLPALQEVAAPVSQGTDLGCLAAGGQAVQCDEVHLPVLSLGRQR